MMIYFAVWLSIVPTLGLDACYSGMSCFAGQQGGTFEGQPSPPAQQTQDLPNYKIPIWKEQLYDSGNNESFAEMISVLNEGGPRSVLIAYHGCKIVNVLSHYKREVITASASERQSL